MFGRSRSVIRVMTPAKVMASVQVASRLRSQYIKDPKVTAEVITYRPFYILGEVTRPGQYPFASGLTVENAVAIAEGYAPRAKQRFVIEMLDTVSQQAR